MVAGLTQLLHCVGESEALKFETAGAVISLIAGSNEAGYTVSEYPAPELGARETARRGDRSAGRRRDTNHIPESPCAARFASPSRRFSEACVFRATSLSPHQC